MEVLDPIASFALPATVLLLLTLLAVRVRQRISDRRERRERRDALDTLAAWPPEAARVLTITERQAYDLLKRAMPGYLVLGQVPLARFIRVPARHSYSEWLQRVGALSADLLLCDAGSRVLAVVDIRPATESERSRKRHERMAKVMRAANIHVHVWREGALPTAAEVRTAMAHTMAPAAPGMKTTNSRPMPLIPVAEMSEVLAEGDRAAMEGAFDPSMEPVPSGFYDEIEPADAR
jgi:Protein of unknown function (DUF2726)